MYLTEDMELPETLAPRGTRPPGRPGGEGGQGAGGRQKKIYKFKMMDSGVSLQVKQGCDIKRPCSAAHHTTLLHHDLLQRS
jgi:hypothetical protein